MSLTKEELIIYKRVLNKELTIADPRVVMDSKSLMTYFYEQQYSKTLVSRLVKRRWYYYLRPFGEFITTVYGRKKLTEIFNSVGFHEYCSGWDECVG